MYLLSAEVFKYFQFLLLCFAFCFVSFCFNVRISPLRIKFIFFSLRVVVVVGSATKRKKKENKIRDKIFLGVVVLVW